MMDDDMEPIDDTELEISKSQKKREAKHVLDLIEKATTLPDKKLKQLRLSENVIKSFQEIRKIKPSGARNRLLKYIAKIIQNEDAEVLEAFLKDADDTHQAENNRFHLLEKRRDRLLDGGDTALTDFISDFPDADRQQIRALIRQAEKEKAQNKAPSASRKLFKYLRTLSEIS